ncbi:MAG: hypothetical protein KatS3mg102_2623 [Planctomycetota bacterium]|nr:MAG: hypothetical protein KatS3mg102_2623 [Planctomycetota bacterium]
MQADTAMTAELLGAASAAAVLGAGLGALPFRGTRRGMPTRWLAGGQALAAGCMIGIGYLLLEVGLGVAPGTAGAGLALGIGYAYGVRWYSGTLEVDPLPDTAVDGPHAARLVLVYALHAAAEGIAMGAAAACGLRLGLFAIGSLALHNIAEAMGLLGALVQRAGRAPGGAAAVAVLARLPQLVLALLTWSLLRTVPGLRDGTLGFAAGALLLLVLLEMLPGAYRELERPRIAVLVSTAAGGVVLGWAMLGPAGG